MKKASVLCTCLALALPWLGSSCRPAPQPDYLIEPVPFTEVTLTDLFWLPRLETNRSVTIPSAFEQCEETGRITNFEIAGGMKEGSFCSAYPFDDSDVFKIIEGASYSLKVHPDPELEKYLDDLIAKISAAQEEDGYLYTARTIRSEKPVIWVDRERWSNLFLGHELYNAGHMYEAAAAHYQATGRRTLLDIAVKNADLVASVFGPGKKTGVPGHQEIEIGLVKLYRLTGDNKYLDLAKFFLDERGHAHGRELFGEYSQDHKPVLEQTEPVGHAVRAVYMYTAMADLAALTGDAQYRKALDTFWENVVSRKMYITGGIGSKSGDESFGVDYELPNETAYCETCAAIANAFWNHRMFLLSGDAKYIDVLERVMYNGVLSGISMAGDRFFYPNPLASSGGHERSLWFKCACCPANISRFIPSIPGYVYAIDEERIFINLFIQSLAEIDLNGDIVEIRQQTAYPWEGKVRITVQPTKDKRFTISVRLPGWSRNEPVPSDLYRYADHSEQRVELRLNGKDLRYESEKGYASIMRTWKSGDRIDLDIPMPIRRVLSHQKVFENRGRTALERGPIVYCAEGIDNGGTVRNLVVPDDIPLREEYRPELLGGITTISGEVTALWNAKGERVPVEIEQDFTAVPYYAWAHRGAAEMAVWLPRTKEKASAQPR